MPDLDRVKHTEGSTVRADEVEGLGRRGQERVAESLVGAPLTACPWCGSARKEWRFSGYDRALGTNFPDQLFHVVRCLECHLEYVENPPDNLADFYTASYYAHQPAGGPVPPSGRFASLKRKLQSWVLACHYGYGSIPDGMRGRILSLLTRSIQHRAVRRYGPGPLPRYVPNGRLLDVGCGNGKWLAWLRELGTWDLTGVEINPAASAEARKLGLHVLTGTLLECAFPERHFDVVRIWHALEHMPNPREILLEVNRIMKPGGLLIIGVPNAGGLLCKLFGSSWCAYDLPRHLVHFNPTTLTSAVEQTGFEVQQLTTMVYGPNTIRWSLHYALNQPHDPSAEKLHPVTESLWQMISAPAYWVTGRLGLGEYLMLRATK